MSNTNAHNQVITTGLLVQDQDQETEIIVLTRQRQKRQN